MRPGCEFLALQIARCLRGAQRMFELNTRRGNRKPGETRQISLHHIYYCLRARCKMWQNPFRQTFLIYKIVFLFTTLLLYYIWLPSVLTYFVQSYSKCRFMFASSPVNWSCLNKPRPTFNTKVVFQQKRNSRNFRPLRHRTTWDKHFKEKSLTVFHIWVVFF